MEENWDRFPVNPVEKLGLIEKKSFVFSYYKFEVWHNGSLITSDKILGEIVGNYENGELDVTVENNIINYYIIRNFSFGEISENINRILWTKDIFNRRNCSEPNNPDIASLFYKEGLLKKIAFTVHASEIIVQFFAF